MFSSIIARAKSALFLFGLVFVAGFTVPAAQASESALGSLFQKERWHLSKLPDSRLQEMLEAAKAPGAARDMGSSNVEFSFAWVDAQPRATGDEQWKCLSEALYFEARGETVKGQFAVAEVIRNRVKSSRFPDSYCGVINQGTGKRYQCQFTYTCDGNPEVISEQKAYERSSKIARAIIDGAAGDLTNGATYYHTTAVSPRWSKTFHRTARYGVHLFYSPSNRTASN